LTVRKEPSECSELLKSEDLVSDLGPRSGRAALVELAFAHFTESMTATLADQSKHARPFSTFAAFQAHFLFAFAAFRLGICATAFSFER
jgi:hypothetical protein